MRFVGFELFKGFVNLSEIRMAFQFVSLILIFFF